MIFFIIYSDIRLTHLELKTTVSSFFLGYKTIIKPLYICYQHQTLSTGQKFRQKKENVVFYLYGYYTDGHYRWVIADIIF